jgi:hypothetical protein
VKGGVYNTRPVRDRMIRGAGGRRSLESGRDDEMGWKDGDGEWTMEEWNEVEEPCQSWKKEQ